MEEIRIPFPKELKSQIEAHPEIDWSLVFKKTALKLLHKLELIEFIESKLDKGEFSEKDAIRLGEFAKQQRVRELKTKGLL